MCQKLRSLQTLNFTIEQKESGNLPDETAAFIIATLVSGLSSLARYTSSFIPETNKTLKKALVLMKILPLSTAETVALAASW